MYQPNLGDVRSGFQFKKRRGWRKRRGQLNRADLLRAMRKHRAALKLSGIFDDFKLTDALTAASAYTGQKNAAKLAKAQARQAEAEARAAEATKRLEPPNPMVKLAIPLAVAAGAAALFFTMKKR